MTYASDLPAPDNRSVGSANPPEDNNLNSRAITAIRDELGANPSVEAATVEAALGARVSKSDVPVNALDHCAADAVINADGTVTLGTDTGTELVAAATKAKNEGRPLYLPAGVYYSTVAIPMLPQIGVYGDGSAGQGTAERSTVVVFDLDSLTDGFSWTREGVSGFGSGGYLRGMTVRSMAGFVDARDLISVSYMAYFHMDDLEVRAAGRYNINVTDCIAIRGNGVFSHRARLAGLWIGGTTPTSTWFSKSYFQETREGPGADVNCLGAAFMSCVFESNGRDVPLSGLGGARVRGGYASFDGACYFENNVGHDIWAGTESVTHLSIGSFHGLLGPDSDTSYAHVRLDSFISSCAVSPGKYDVRNGRSFLIHPSARGVVGAIGKATGTPIAMTDGSDPALGVYGHLLAMDMATGELRTYGRLDPRYRNVHVSGALLLPDGLAATPGLRFAADPDTGIARFAANKLSMVAGGTAYVHIDPTETRTVNKLRASAGLTHDGGSAGFYGAAPVAQPSLTYSRTGETTAEAQLRAALSALGLVADSTTA